MTKSVKNRQKQYKLFYGFCRYSHKKSVSAVIFYMYVVQNNVRNKMD